MIPCPRSVQGFTLDYSQLKLPDNLVAKLINACKDSTRTNSFCGANQRLSLMTKEVKILIADDDAGHARLIERNLQRVGLHNPIERFENGQDVLDFLFRGGEKRKTSRENGYLLLLDIRMPKVDGVQVLRHIKGDPELRKIPVIMLTTTDDPQEVARCHALGCSIYIVKPVDYDKFSEAIKQLGMFVSLVQVPQVN